MTYVVYVVQLDNIRKINMYVRLDIILYIRILIKNILLDYLYKTKY